MYGDRLNVLVDPAISADALMALRSIVLRLQRGELTAEEAERQASEASPRLGGLLNFRTWPLEARSIVIAALITAAGEVIGARTAPPDVTNVHVAAIVERAVELPKKAAQRKARARKPKPKAPKPKL